MSGKGRKGIGSVEKIVKKKKVWMLESIHSLVGGTNLPGIFRKKKESAEKP